MTRSVHDDTGTVPAASAVDGPDPVTAAAEAQFGKPPARVYDLGVAQAWLREYSLLAPAISARLDEFRALGRHGSDEDIFCELAFCLLTPQSKAQACWEAVCHLRESGLLASGNPAGIEGQLVGVRFHRTKAQRIVEARERFFSNGRLTFRRLVASIPPMDAREWLVSNVRGLGYKEASHFLRNIGRGEDLAILDRHVLRNLAAAGVIGEVPRSLSKSAYLAIEQKARQFAAWLGMSLGELDLLLWAHATGGLFK
ncbi:MAG: N-glycosylase/DNA lyase [Armatimonadetes bacterium]|nr:N-glycosylase/DNA lyase [Armatimonadota bacterium]